MYVDIYTQSNYYYYKANNLLSLSIIVIVVWPMLVTLMGNVAELTAKINDSFTSNMLSLVTEIFNIALVLPAGKMTLYGPLV